MATRVARCLSMMSSRSLVHYAATIAVAIAAALTSLASCKPSPEPAADTSKVAASAAGTGTASAKSAKSAGHASLAAYPDAVISCSDTSSGASFEVEPDGRTLVAKGGDGSELFKGDVIAQCGSPAVGSPVVRNIAVNASSLEITFGKHSYATLDLKSRALSCKGSD